MRWAGYRYPDALMGPDTRAPSLEQQVRTTRGVMARHTVIRMVIRAVTMAHDEQVRMWECVRLTSGAAPLTAAGPLRWVRSLDGYRLAGSHLPARDPSETGR